MRKFFYNVKEQFFKEQERWFLWFPVLFALGIGLFFLLPKDISIWWTLGVIELLIGAAIFFRRNIFALVWLMLLSMVVLGFTDIQLKSVYLANNHKALVEQQTYVKGRVAKLDYNYRGNQRLIVEPAKNFEGEILGKLKISTRYKDAPLFTGQCVEFAAQIFPLAKAVIPGGFQFDRKAFFEGVDATGYALSAVLPTDCEMQMSVGDKFNAFVAKLRTLIMNRVKAVLPANEASVATAIIAGEQGSISQELTDNYRNSGLAHFLSISGLHMTMLAGLMFFLVRLIMALIPPLAIRYDSKRVAAVFAILLSIFYLFISGMQIPAQRAFIMNFIVVLGVLFNRRAISMKTVAWAAFIILILFPQSLVSVSFQMSFAAVIGLIAFYEQFAEKLHRFLNGDGTEDSLLLTKIIKVVWIYLVGILVSDLVASLATLPFAVYHFNKIAIYTSVANLAAGPIIGFVIMPFVLLALLLMPLGLDVIPLKIVGVGISWVNDITTWVSSLPHAAMPVLSMPLWGMLLIVFGGLWLCLWTQKWRLWGMGLIALGFLSIVWVKVPDVVVDDKAEVFAVKDNAGNMVVLPVRGNDFTKKLWLDKTASYSLTEKQNELLKKIYKGEAEDKKWLDLSCNRLICVYKDRVRLLKGRNVHVDGELLNLKELCGAQVYLEEKAKIESVREYMGNRLWNK